MKEISIHMIIAPKHSTNKESQDKESQDKGSQDKGSPNYEP